MLAGHQENLHHNSLGFLLGLSSRYILNKSIDMNPGDKSLDISLLFLEGKKKDGTHPNNSLLNNKVLSRISFALSLEN